MVAMSTPSMLIVPELISTRRRRVARIVDLPEPVRPQMPIFWPGRMSRSIEESAGAVVLL